MWFYRAPFGAAHASRAFYAPAPSRDKALLTVAGSDYRIQLPTRILTQTWSRGSLISSPRI